MKISFVALLIAAICISAFAQSASPRVTTCEPQSAKKGEVVTVTGENLQKEIVAKVFLTDDKTDFQVEVTEQTATTLKFKIPVKIDLGRLSLMVETAGKDRRQIVQPVKVTIAD